MDPSNDDNDDSSSSNTRSIVDLFDRICFSRGDEDAICVLKRTAADTGEEEEEEDSICFLELQELSGALACQLAYRYGVPDYVLIDCFGHVAAEAVAVLACMRIARPFVPVSILEQHSGGRLTVLVNELRNSSNRYRSSSSHPTSPISQSSVVAICCCENDEDPALGVFYAAGIHNILYCDRTGNLREQLRVPSSLPDSVTQQQRSGASDDLYILFTSGTSGAAPRAVVGSHTSTLRRLQWFHDTFPASPRVARRTRLTFVDGITELLTPLTCSIGDDDGSTSVLVAVEPQLLQQHGIGILLDWWKPTQITLLPSQLDMMLSTRTNLLSSSLERIIISGEVCSVSTWTKFQQALATHQRHSSKKKEHSSVKTMELINLYGQTETTGDVTCAVLTDMSEDTVVVNGVVAVGKSILPDHIHITRVVMKAGTPTDATISSGSSNEKMDESTATMSTVVVAEETLGEIIISGTNLSIGYLSSSRNKPLTSFTTGDIGFCRDDGIWYVKGRCDDVEKINGVLTSPFEAETAFWQFYNKEMSPDHKVAATIVDGSLHMICEGGPPTTQTMTPTFSRLAMNQAGYPWNLIPKRVFFHQTIPRNTTGAGKVNRSRLKTLVRNLISNPGTNNHGDDHTEPSTTSAVATTSSLHIYSIILSVLQLGDSSVLDDNKSFIELGGDSASAVHLLYRLRSAAQNKEMPNINTSFLLYHLTAVDILLTDSIYELKEVIASGGSGSKGRTNDDDDEDPNSNSKRPRLENLGHRKSRQLPAFSPLPVECFHFAVPKPDDEAQMSFHCAVKFAACVDSGPRKSTCDADDVFYCACQGGVIQKVSTTSGNVVASRQFPGWMFQASCLPMQQAVFAFGHSREIPDRGGLAVSLSLDLQTIIWQRALDSDVDRCRGGGGVTCTPIIMKTRGELWVTTANQLHVLDIDTGENRACLFLPDDFYAIPAFEFSRATVLFAGSRLFKVSVLAKQSDDENDWSAAPIAPDHKEVLQGQFYDSSIGHVHKDLLRLCDSHTLIADSCGSIHVLNTQTDLSCNNHDVNAGMVSMSLKVSSYPLTSPTAFSESPSPPTLSSSSISTVVVVGAYDGTVTYLSLKDDATLSKICDFDAGATLYTRPLALPDGSCVICTTAGDVIRVKHHSSSSDSKSDSCYTAIKEISRHRVFAEIWSDPLLLRNEASTASSSSSPTFRIAFGARDSKVHIMTV
jgi:acyl-CoA synthetase (AMP-forming)/AMP-acid ligase II